MARQYLLHCIWRLILAWIKRQTQSFFARATCVSSIDIYVIEGKWGIRRFQLLPIGLQNNKLKNEVWKIFLSSSKVSFGFMDCAPRFLLTPFFPSLFFFLHLQTELWKRYWINKLDYRKKTYLSIFIILWKKFTRRLIILEKPSYRKLLKKISCCCVKISRVYQFLGQLFHGN